MSQLKGNSLNSFFSTINIPDVKIPTFPSKTFNIADFGAIGDGMYMNTNSINAAIIECSTQGGGTVFIPEGLWLTGPISMKSNVNLHLERGAIVTFSRNFEDYPLIVSSFEGLETIRHTSPLNGNNLENIAITGAGVFDGAGEAWRPVKKEKLNEKQWNSLVKSGGVVNQTGHIWWPTQGALEGADFYKHVKGKSVSYEECLPYSDFLRPNMVSLIDCKNVLLDGPTFQNSPAWCLHPLYCENITIRNVFVKNPWFSQNGDGLDLEACKNAYIHDSIFDVGDDAICIKSGKDAEGRQVGKPCENVTVKKCTVYHGHGGFVIGSEMSGGVKNIYVSDCCFLGTDVGLRFKSCRGRGGVVENIFIENIKMKDIPNEAIIFSTFYESPKGSEDVALPVSEETPEFKNFYIRDVFCAGAETAINICGLAEMPIKNIHMANIKISANNGMECTNANDLFLENIELHTKEDVVMHYHNCCEVQITNVTGADSTKKLVQITGAKSCNIVCK